MWILRGLVAGVGALEYLWRSNLTPTFAVVLVLSALPVAIESDNQLAGIELALA